MKKELKPCPFCGGKAKITDTNTEDKQHFYYIQCTKCGAAACFGNESETKKDAIKAWNRRINEET